jgi:hypothetical protein
MSSSLGSSLDVVDVTAAVSDAYTCPFMTAWLLLPLFELTCN